MTKPPFRRLLMLSTSVPVPPTNGSSMRVWAMLRCLALEGFAVELMCFGNPEDEACALQMGTDLCAGVEVIPHPGISLSGRTDIPGRLAAIVARKPYSVVRSRSCLMRRRISERLAAGGIDGILCEETNLLINLPADLPLPLIVDHQNVEYLLIRRYIGYAGSLARSLYARLEAAHTRDWERFACMRAQLVLACSEHDRLIFKQLHAGSPVAIAPNVIDLASYRPEPEGNPDTVLYSGGMDWYPNRDAVQYFAHEVLPIVRRQVPGVRFIIAGRNPSDEFRREFASMTDVVFTGTIHDMRDEIAKACVCVVPLRIGSGTRLKILEAAAISKAVVSTSLGAEGLDLEHGSEILIADDPQSFARAIAGLLRDPARRAQMGAAANRRVRESYGLPALAAALRVAFGQLPALSSERSHSCGVR